MSLVFAAGPKGTAPIARARLTWSYWANLYYLFIISYHNISFQNIWSPREGWKIVHRCAGNVLKELGELTRTTGTKAESRCFIRDLGTRVQYCKVETQGNTKYWSDKTREAQLCKAETPKRGNPEAQKCCIHLSNIWECTKWQVIGELGWAQSLSPSLRNAWGHVKSETWANFNVKLFNFFQVGQNRTSSFIQLKISFGSTEQKPQTIWQDYPVAFIATAAGSASAWSLFCKAASASSIITLSAITEEWGLSLKLSHYCFLLCKVDRYHQRIQNTWTTSMGPLLQIWWSHFWSSLFQDI